MPAIRVQIEGIEKVAAELKRRGANVQRGLEVIAQAGAVIIERQAAANAGGGIGREMTHATTAKTANAVEVSVGPSKKAWFAHFVEFGTRAHPVKPRARQALQIGDRFRARASHPGTTERPFLRPAVDQRQAEAQDAMGKKATTLIEA